MAKKTESVEDVVTDPLTLALQENARLTVYRRVAEETARIYNELYDKEFARARRLTRALEQIAEADMEFPDVMSFQQIARAALNG